MRLRLSGGEEPPTILHVTHYKAGSQWINEILLHTVGKLIVAPRDDLRQFLHSKIRSGRVYPTLYVTRRQYASVSLPANTRKFLVFRDLRDTLISGYFSLKISHARGELEVDARRFSKQLDAMSIEDGLRETMALWLPTAAARIQESWVEGGETFIRYEDLLTDDVDILERALVEEARLPVDPEEFRHVVKETRFKNLSGGRDPGNEDPNAHLRKGIAGDWRNYFTDSLKARFKEAYGDLLIATGYEADKNW